jgi:hypothetical protein
LEMRFAFAIACFSSLILRPAFQPAALAQGGRRS